MPLACCQINCGAVNIYRKSNTMNRIWLLWRMSPKIQIDVSPHAKDCQANTKQSKHDNLVNYIHHDTRTQPNEKSCATADLSGKGFIKLTKHLATQPSLSLPQ